MKEFVKMAGAVAVGTLVASGVALKVMLNTKVLKMYTKKAMEIGEEIAKEIVETDFEDYDE